MTISIIIFQVRKQLRTTIPWHTNIMACLGDTTGDDPYVILDAKENATQEEIRRCYQRKLLKVRQSIQKRYSLRPRI